MASGAKHLKLFVHNLSWTTNSLKLKQYFSKFGQVNNANVLFDRSTGLSRGYGFVVFNNEIGYNAAQEAKKHILEGNNINIAA